MSRDSEGDEASATGDGSGTRAALTSDLRAGGAEGDERTVHGGAPRRDADRPDPERVAALDADVTALEDRFAAMQDLLEQVDAVLDAIGEEIRRRQ